MACSLRGLWIFRAESEVKLMLSRRFPTVEGRVRALWKERYIEIPCDEEVSLRFLLDVLLDDDTNGAAGVSGDLWSKIPPPFGTEFEGNGNLGWRPAQERKREKDWPLGPICFLRAPTRAGAAGRTAGTGRRGGSGSLSPSESEDDDEEGDSFSQCSSEPEEGSTSSDGAARRARERASSSHSKPSDDNGEASLQDDSGRPADEDVIWPCVFLAKKGFYLLAVVGLLRPELVQLCHRSTPNANGPLSSTSFQRPEAIDIPEVTAAFVLLEDVADFLSPDLSIADVDAIAELQYYLKAALPFGSPVNTNYSLLRKIRHLGFDRDADKKNYPHHAKNYPSGILTDRSGSAELPRAHAAPLHRIAAWKPFLLKDNTKPRLMLSVVESVNCTIYGKPETYQDECFVHGTVYCSAEIAGVPEVCVPLSYGGDIFSGSTTSSPQPELCVYNCAQLSLDHRLNTAQISCTPPSSPFVLCRLVQCLRYRYANVQAFPVRGYYQVKEVSPVELRLLLQIEFGPELLACADRQPQCQVRIPFPRGSKIKGNRLRCSDKSTFSVTDDASVIIWQIRAGGEMKSASLIGELSVENSGSEGGDGGGTMGGNAGAESLSGGGALAMARHGGVGNNHTRDYNSGVGSGGTQYAAAGGGYGGNKGSGATTFGSHHGANHGRNNGYYQQPSGYTYSQGAAHHSHMMNHWHSQNYHRQHPLITGSTLSSTMHPIRSGSSYHSDPYAASAACKQQSVKSKCIPEYCEVFLKIPNATFSGLSIDPKGVTVYPATKLSISIQSEVLAGRYQIWNAADDNIKGHQPLLGVRGGDE